MKLHSVSTCVLCDAPHDPTLELTRHVAEHLEALGEGVCSKAHRKAVERMVELGSLPLPEEVRRRAEPVRSAAIAAVRKGGTPCRTIH